MRPPWEGSMPMDPATEQVLQVALALPEAARLELIEALLASQEQSSAPPFGSAWLREIRRRSDEVEAGTVQPDPWHVVRQRVRERLEERSSG
ncbi:MAG: addiction module protein [Isosphaeraceae bacterium]